MTTRCVEWITEKTRAGLSVNIIEEMFKNNYQREVCGRIERFWTDFRFAVQLAVCEKTDVLNLPSLEHLYDEMKGCIPTGHIITDFIITNFRRFEATTMKQFESTTAKWISCDHTFKTASNVGYRREDGKWIKQYKAVFCILNEIGRVMQWQFTSSDGFSEVRAMFESLRERFRKSGCQLSGIFVDNCCKWRESLNHIFEDVPVKLDLFHAVQRVVREVPKRITVSRDIANDFGVVFREKNDHGTRREQPTPKPKVILKNLEHFIEKWRDVKNDRDGSNILNTKAMHEIENLKKHIIKGCLSDIDVGCGTSRDERLHRDMNKIVSSTSIGAELAYV
jgi:hypothetical protein